MNIDQVKSLHLSGLPICWENTSYQIKGKDPDNLIVFCTFNNYCSGLSDEHAEKCFIHTHPMTAAEQAQYDALVASGSITPGTPVVPYTSTERLAQRLGIPNGILDSNIQIWIDDEKGSSVAVTFAPSRPGPFDATHEKMPDGSTFPFRNPIRCF